MTLTPRELDQKRKARLAATRRKYRWSGFELLPVKKAPGPEKENLPARCDKALLHSDDLLKHGSQDEKPNPSAL